MAIDTEMYSMSRELNQNLTYASKFESLAMQLSVFPIEKGS